MLLSHKEYDIIKRLLQDAKRQKTQLSLVVEKDQVKKVSLEHDTLSHAETGTPLSVLLKLRTQGTGTQGKEAILKSNTLDLSLVQKAVAIARALPSKETAPFPPAQPKKYLALRPDRKLFDVQSDTLVEDAQQIIEILKEKKIIASAGGVTAVAETRLVASTSGVWHEDTMAQYGIWASAVSASKKSTYSESDSKMHLFSPQHITEFILDKVVQFEHTSSLAKVPNFRKLPIVFVPSTVSGLLQNAFIENLNAESVDKKKSLFVGKLGERMLGNITIIDDGRRKEGVKTSGCDDEGNPRSTTSLVKRGVVARFITDAYQAQRQKLPMTGNGSLFGPDFTNLVVESFGSLPEKAIIIDNIIGAHTSNSLTTDFSVKVENGYALLGKTIIPLKPFMVSGKMLEFLRNAIAAGKDIEERDGVYTGSVAGFCSLVP